MVISSQQVHMLLDRLNVHLRLPAFSILLITCLTCERAFAQQVDAALTKDSSFTLRIYSPQVGDSFSLFIHLPAGYDAAEQKKYPVVYLLDANLYFDMLAPIASKYAEVGMLPPIILVGVGYKDFAEMDSLRTRDYTYPKALPQYEMALSGRADYLLRFLSESLLPQMDASFHTDTLQRILAGHSLSGYFAMYALLQELSSGKTTFHYYIAASPSLHYNKYWLPAQLRRLQAGKASKSTSAYITFGGPEDAEDADEPGLLKVGQLTSQMDTMMLSFGINGLADVLGNLGHMESPIPTFIKGLQRVLHAV